MSKILYLNQKLLFDNRLSDFVNSYDYDWNNLGGIIKMSTGIDSNYIRAGKNVYPLNNDIAQDPRFRMPAYDPAYNLTFADITDLRLQTLRQTQFDKRWLILWSGGIDSMVILASILKNLPAEDLANIDIACNRVSIYENPTFFYDYILPNFNIIDSNSMTFDAQMLNKYYIIDGEPADQLYGGIASKTMLDGNTILRNWRTDPDGLIDFFTHKVDRKFAEWYYESTKENIESVDIPIENYYDFCWWLFFNNAWLSVLIRPLQFQPDLSVEASNMLFDNFIPWFDTVEYQKWSMANGLGTKYGTNIAQRKLASKKYIYDFDHDEYYYHFKTKMESTSRSKNYWGNYFCILDDNTRLSLDHDMNRILELLPEHINTDVVTKRL